MLSENIARTVLNETAVRPGLVPSNESRRCYTMAIGHVGVARSVILRMDDGAGVSKDTNLLFEEVDDLLGKEARSGIVGWAAFGDGL